MSESLLEAARRELPLDWTTAGVPDLVNARVGDTWAKVGRIPLTDLFVATFSRSTSPGYPIDEAFTWLRAQLKAQRAACDRALGGGWRRWTDAQPADRQEFLIAWEGYLFTASLHNGILWAPVAELDGNPPPTNLFWHPLPELPEVKP